MFKFLKTRTTSLSGTDCQFQEEFYKSSYRKFSKCQDRRSSTFGAVYNLEFTPSNDYTVVACHANQALALYDTRLESRTCSIANAHEDGVNVISFIDTFLFATGSDDGLIKIWDIRMLSEKSVAVLKGHKGWVKNVEVDRRSNSLFSVAFNDGVRKWDINKLDSYEQGLEDNLLFKMPKAVRLRISPDSSTMLISQRKDHLVVLYNFDGTTVEEVKGVVPKTFPLSNQARFKLSRAFQSQRKNIATIHDINSSRDGSYRTPLSIAYHPDSKLVAMRLVDIQHFMLQEEMSILYDVGLSRPSHAYQTTEKTSKRFLRRTVEDSPESVIDYIKEISFSKPDGRVLASPFGNSVRLLAIDKLCTPMDVYCDSRYPVDLEKNSVFTDIVVCSEHRNGVLTCRLNSHNMCLVSGCIDGDVIFNWPRF